MHRHKNFEKIWNSVPPNYYQKGVKNNFLQRLWHTRKLSVVLSLMNNRHKNILDVGSASGWFLSQIAAKYPTGKHTGIDVHKKAIEYGKKDTNLYASSMQTLIASPSAMNRLISSSARKSLNM